jgi:hypothetical protein
LFQALLGFVALNPTYILPVLLRNAKPNNGRFSNRVPKVSFLIRLAVFLTRGAARVKILIDVINFTLHQVLVGAASGRKKVGL